MDPMAQQILRQRMHGLYLSRPCDSIKELSHELLGLHCWFHRNVVFSSLIRGAGIAGWKTALTKTWLYRGTLYGVVYEDLPELLALHEPTSYLRDELGESLFEQILTEVVSLMEDGVFSRAEMRRIFSREYDEKVIREVLSSWGGIFVYLARQGKVAFRNMTSRDFDLIGAEPTQTSEEVLPALFRRYISAYGPATLTDAAGFLGFWKNGKKELANLDLSEYSTLEYEKNKYYYLETPEIQGIPELTLLSGFDPLIVSYTNREFVLPQEYKKAVILVSGICLPTIAVNGQVAGLWNIQKNQPTITFFSSQPKRLQDLAFDMVMKIIRMSSQI
jgi:hypothetical protein